MTRTSTPPPSPTLREFRAVSVALDTFWTQLGDTRPDDPDDLDRMHDTITRVRAATSTAPRDPERSFGFAVTVPAPEPPPPPATTGGDDDS